MDSSLKNVPLTIYDFLGYLFPGIVFWSLILFSPDLSVVFFPEWHFPPHTQVTGEQKSTELKTSRQLLFSEVSKSLENKSWALIFAILVGLYITGHVNSVISRQLLERWLTGGVFDFPVTYILGKVPETIGGKIKNFFVYVFFFFSQ